jgi:alpha-tubulin suppressor-like RCC1 family protein
MGRKVSALLLFLAIDVACIRASEPPVDIETRSAALQGDHGRCSRARISVASGLSHTCALLSDRTVECWGDDSSGQLGDAKAGTSMPAGGPNPRPVPNLGDVTALAAGDDHTCALLATGGIVCWGQGADGRLGRGFGPPALDPAPAAIATIPAAVAISAGSRYTCAALANGNIYCWGLFPDVAGVQGSWDPKQIGGVTNATSVAAGGGHVCARLADGQVRCWGSNAAGQLGTGDTSAVAGLVSPLGLGDVAEIAAGQNHTCARQSDGSVLCWGANDAGQVGNGLADPMSPTPSSVVANVTDIFLSASSSTSCALLADGTFSCWGKNDVGQLGTGVGPISRTPVAVNTLAGGAVLSSNGSHTCAVQLDGHTFCWGQDVDGDLGTASTGQSGPTPVPVLGGTGFSSRGQVCRLSAGPCDIFETCTGDAADCPSDAFAVGGSPCHRATDSCDTDMVCSGAGASCPVAPLPNDCDRVTGDIGGITVNLLGGAGVVGGMTFSALPDGPGIIRIVELSPASPPPPDAFVITAGLTGPPVRMWRFDTAVTFSDVDMTVHYDPAPLAGATPVLRYAGNVLQTFVNVTDDVIDAISFTITATTAAPPPPVSSPGGIIGDSCAQPSDCGAGLFCVDGVCCTSDCGGGDATDCQACSVQSGGTTDGVCTAVTSAQVCRAKTTGCDVAESCTSISTFCPANGFSPAGTVCATVGRPGPCTPVAVCSGDDAVCPQPIAPPCHNPIQGTLSWQGAPLSGDLAARLLVRGDGVPSESTVPSWSATPDDAGNYSSGDVDPGLYGVSVRDVRCAQAPQSDPLAAANVNVRTGLTSTQNFDVGATAGLVVGTLARAGLPLAAHIALDADACVPLHTDGNGQFAAFLSPGSHTAVMTSDAGVQVDEVSFQIVAGQTTELGTLSAVIGGPCQTADNCGGGFCVDGVCCEEACGGGILDDCMACSVAAGGQADGACTPALPPSCQGPDFCDGTAQCSGVDTICPAAALPSNICAGATDDTLSACGYLDSMYSSCVPLDGWPGTVGSAMVKVGALNSDDPPYSGRIKLVRSGVGCAQLPGFKLLGSNDGYVWNFEADPPIPTGTPINLCLTYADGWVSGLEKNLLIYHNPTNSCDTAGWTQLAGKTQDQGTNELCANTPSLSPFIIVEPLPGSIPVVTLPANLTVGATSTGGAVVSFVATAADLKDGPLATTCIPASGSEFPIGTTTVACNAVDSQHITGSASFTVRVRYDAPMDGTFFLQPINPDGSSIFKKGSTIPVKFRLTGASAGITDLTARLLVAKVSNGVTGTFVEGDTNVSADGGNLFRSAGGGQYMFNLSTKSMTTGTWSLRADLGDGVDHIVSISLK